MVAGHGYCNHDGGMTTNIKLNITQSPRGLGSQPSRSSRNMWSLSRLAFAPVLPTAVTPRAQLVLSPATAGLVSRGWAVGVHVVAGATGRMRPMEYFPAMHFRRYR